MNARQKWRNAIRDSGLDQATRAVAWTLDTYMDGHGRAWPSRASLATGAGCSVRTVDRALGRLRMLGFVRVRRGHGRSTNVYLAALPSSDTHVATPETVVATNGTSSSDTRATRTRSTEQEDHRSRDQELERVDAEMLKLARSWMSS